MSHSHCGNEDHSHGGHSHSPPPDSIPGDSLFNQIDRERVRCLNERVEGMAQSIIKPWNRRLDTQDVYHLTSGKANSRYLKATQTPKWSFSFRASPPPPGVYSLQLLTRGQLHRSCQAQIHSHPSTTRYLLSSNCQSVRKSI